MTAAPNIRWPRSADDLRSTEQCPSCFAVLASSRCDACGLELRHAEAGRLARDSARIAELLEARHSLIERMHGESAPAPAPSWAPPAGAPVGAAPVRAAAAPPLVAPSVQAPIADGRPRRSGVQLALVIAATGLLSLGFLGFLIYAFVNWGLLWQALVLGLVTTGAVVGASLLRRAGLQRSAEGVAVFALVMALLDVWAARVNDLAGLAGGTASGYWGTALLALGGLGLLWCALSGIAAPGVVGAVLSLPGAGLLAAAIVPGAALAERWWLGGAVAAAVGLLGGALRGRASLRPVERALWLGTAGAALASAGLAGFALPAPPLADLALPAVLLLASAHCLLLLRGEPERSAQVFAAAFALLAVTSLSVVSVPFAARAASAELYLLVTLPVLALAATLLERLSRGAAAPRRRVALIAAIGAWALGTVPAGGALLALGASWALGAGAGVPEWTAGFADEAPLHGSLAIAAIGALAAAVLIEVLGQLPGRVPPARRQVQLALGATLLVLAPAALPILGLRLVLAATLAVLAAVALRTALAAHARGALLAVLLGGAATLLALGWSGPQLLWAALLGAALLPLAFLLPRADRAVLTLGLLPIAAIGGLVHPAALDAAPWLGAATAGLLLLGLLLQLPPGAASAPLRVLAAGGAPVLGALLVGSLLLQFEAAPATCALVVAAVGVVAMAAALPAGALRIPIETGGALVLLVAALLVIAAPEVLAAQLLLLATAALLVAVRREGVVGAPGARKHWGWLAYALGALALLEALRRGGVELLEARTLPLAGVLLLLAAWVALHERMRGRATAAGPALLLAGLLLALLPSALIDDAVPRSVIVLLAGGAALLAGAFGPAGRGRRWFDALAAAGAAATLLVAVLRIGQGSGEPARTEPWALGAVALLTAAAIGLAGRWRGRAGLAALPAALLAAGPALLALAGAMAAGAEQGALRGAVAVAVLAAVHPIVGLLRRAPWSGWVGWTALALGALLGLRLLLLGGTELEAVTAPIGLALLLGGALALRQRPVLRSWPALGPGTALLLVIGAVAAMVDPVAWRIALVGVLAVAAIVLGAVLRLQAPFLLGIAVALAHGLVQLRPWIRVVYEATPIFVWPVLGGALVLALAIRFERRLQSLRRVVLRVASLR